MKNEIRFKNFLNTSLSSETYIILQVLFPKKKKTDPQNIRSFRQRENVISSIRCGGDRSRRWNREASVEPINANRRTAMGRNEKGKRSKISPKRRFSYIYILLSDNWRISVARSRDNEGLERGLDVPTGAFCSSSLLFTHPWSLYSRRRRRQSQSVWKINLVTTLDTLPRSRTIFTRRRYFMLK